MGDASEKPWSDNPYAPRLPSTLYFGEKETFAGSLIGAIFYGIAIALFFQCMGALLNPVNRLGNGIKWPLVAHTVAMFLFLTVFAAMSLVAPSIAYTDNRGFPGADGVLPPGPFGYIFSLLSRPIGLIPKVMLLLNGCLADLLLLYRCYVIYGMNYWIIAFPSLVYLASFATGIVFIYRASQSGSIASAFAASVGIPYFSILTSLNVLLTIMIALRLVLHDRNTRATMGAPAGTSRLYTAIVTMLVESCALYAVSSLLLIIPWAAGSWVTEIFVLLLADIQVIAPFLVILQVAKQDVARSNAVVPTSVGSIRFESQGRSIGSDESLRRRESTR